MLLLKPFPTTHKSRISLPSALDLTWLLTFAAPLVAVPSAFGGDSSVVFVGNKTKGPNPHRLARTSAEETWNVGGPRYALGLNVLLWMGKADVWEVLVLCFFRTLALAVVRAIEQGYSRPKSSF